LDLVAALARGDEARNPLVPFSLPFALLRRCQNALIGATHPNCGTIVVWRNTPEAICSDQITACIHKQTRAVCVYGF
tara:strand:+ start:226 stop:456 length:231 start_codon:yes stop_codon:yes gene_type:complete